MITYLALTCLSCPIGSAPAPQTQAHPANSADHALDTAGGELQSKGLSSADWDDLRSAMDMAQRRFSAMAGAHFTRSARFGWRANFDGHGFALSPDSGEWRFGLELVGYGRPGQLIDAGAHPNTHADGERLTYGWSNSLSEWWVHDERGLEHGFTVLQPLAPSSSQCSDADEQELLVFELALRGELRAVLTPDARGVRMLSSGNEEALSYDGLIAFDADGDDLDAWMELDGQHLRLVVDTANAQFPITVDPLVQSAYIKASNTDAGDGFGASVAISGDTVVIGAPGEDGNATGVNGDESNNMGWLNGAAYVFVRSGTSWVQQAYLKPERRAWEGESFGSAVAISGDTIVVGANGNKDQNSGVNTAPFGWRTFSGAAYVFVRSGASWTQEAFIKASNPGEYHFFGSAVAVSGNTVVVGAYGEDGRSTGVDGDQLLNGSSKAGAAYVFSKTGGTWHQEAYLKASNTGSYDRFGSSVSVSLDTIVVGAPEEDGDSTGVNGGQNNNFAIESGAAYEFSRIGSTWHAGAYLKSSNAEPGDRFGTSVSASADRLLIGAPREDGGDTGVNGNQASNSVTQSGAAYLFARSGSTWTQTAYLKASNTGESDYFGYSVALGDQVAVVGAPFERGSATGLVGDPASNTAPEAGAAYIFRSIGSSWQPDGYLKAAKTDPSDFLGFSSSISGSTVIVGVPGEDGVGVGLSADPTSHAATDSGAAYTFELDAPGMNYCPSVANSSGRAATIAALGSDMATHNTVALVADRVPIGSFGFFLVSRLQGLVVGPGGSSGNLCLGGTIGRFVGPGQVQTASSVGMMRLTLDLTQLPQPNGFVGATAGDTWNFAAWFRDSVGGVATSNFTNGISIVFN